MRRQDVSQDNALGRVMVWFVGGVGLVVGVFVLALVVFRLFAKFML